MKKIINTFKYGEKDVKRVLLLTIISGIAAVALLVAAILGFNFIFFFGALIMLFVTISLAQTMGIRESESNNSAARPIGEAYSDAVRNDTVRLGEAIPEEAGITSDDVDIQYVYEDDMDELAESVSGKKKSKKKAKKEKIKKGKRKKEKRRKEKKKKLIVVKKKENDTAASEEYGHGEAVSENQDNIRTESLDREYMEESVEQSVEEPAEEPEILQITEEEARSYNKKKIKKTLHKFKVKKDHRKVMIDRCDKFKIYQTPAYIWKDGNTFNILLIEQEPRIISLPLYMLSEIEYLKKQPASEYSDYAVFRGSGGLLADMFKPYLPDYTHSTVVDDMTSYKNLYGIGPGIYFTNTSAVSLFDLLGAEFVVNDKVTASNKVNIYFKEAYKANIKLRDNVLDANGYADSISRILDNLAKSTISYNEFKETLNLMIKNKLITEEFASYYMDVRDKLSR